MTAPRRVEATAVAGAGNPNAASSRVRLRVAQDRPVRGKRPFAHELRSREIERLGLGLRRRHFEQPLLVAPIRREEREGLDRGFRREEIGDAAALPAPGEASFFWIAPSHAASISFFEFASRRRDGPRGVRRGCRGQRHVQHEHGVGVVVGEHATDGFADALRRRAAADVERVVARTLGRQQRVEPGHRLRREHRELYAVVDDAVGCHQAGASPVGHHGEPVSREPSCPSR